MTSPQAEAIARAGQALSESARAHKRAVSFHREALRRDMAELDRLRRYCESAGITFIVQSEAQEGKA